MTTAPGMACELFTTAAAPWVAGLLAITNGFSIPNFSILKSAIFMSPSF